MKNTWIPLPYLGLRPDRDVGSHCPCNLALGPRDHFHGNDDAGRRLETESRQTWTKALAWRTALLDEYE